jgi:hypothetical protein
MSDTIATCPRTWEVAIGSFLTVASGEEVFIIGPWFLDNPISFHNMIHVIFCSTQLSSRRLASATSGARLVLFTYNLDRQSKAWLIAPLLGDVRLRI